MNDVVRDERGRWAPGNPGRPLGSRNTLAARVLDTFLKDFEAHGAPALVAVREKSPIDYWRIATALLPQHRRKLSRVQAAAALSTPWRG